MEQTTERTTEQPQGADVAGESAPRVLRTARLRLRAFGAADQEGLTTLWHDPDVRRYLWDDELVSSAQVAQIIRASEQCLHSHGVGMYSIFLSEAPTTLAGFCGLREFEAPGELELLYGMYPRYWGQGLVTEAARCVLQHGFKHSACRSITAATDTPNQASVRVLRRLGMNFVERKRWHGLDTLFYALTRDELAQI
ncbi:MAG: GNAT family N-acetyltransferase [Pseudomonadota bacterium]